jgi:hypothetical protein
MFKRMIVALFAVISLSAIEDHAAPISSTSDEAEPTAVLPPAENVTRILYWLEKGISIMEEDSNKEETLMRSIAATARGILIKLMALTKIKRQAEGIKAGLILDLYQAYVRFNVKLEATYGKRQLVETIQVDEDLSTQ